MPWKKLLVWATGQIDEALRQKLEFVLEENRVYRALLDRHSPRWRLNDAECEALAEKGKPLGKLLGEVITIVQPETLLKWHRQLVAGKWDFSRRRNAKPGRPPASIEIERLVLQFDFNITETPTAEWTAQQVVNAFPYDTAPKYLVRDRDSIYGSAFVRRVGGRGIQQKLISPRAPWQSPYVERLVGSIRRECLDRIILFNEWQLRRTLESYFEYYHKIRPHRSLTHDSPIPRPVEAPDRGKVMELPLVGGLHHHYLRQAA